MNKVRELLRLVVNHPAKVANLTDRELDLTLRVARRSRLLGRLAARLKAGGSFESLHGVVRDQLESVLAMAAARQRLASWELNRIARAVKDDRDTPIIVLKGCAYQLLDLPNAPGRIFTDVDLLTLEDRLKPLESMLNRHGWVTAELNPYDDNYYRKWTHELPPLMHFEREMEIDLHHNILPRTARLKPDGRLLVENSRSVAGSRFRVLADEDLVLHAMAHLMVSDDLADKLRDLVDIADLVTHFSSVSESFWARLTLRAEQLDLRRPAYYSVRYMIRLIQTELPEEFVAAIDGWGPPKPVLRLMDRLVPCALFPSHPDNRYPEWRFQRFLLFVRSHWIRMPPWLLAYHLTHKFVATRLNSRQL